MVSVAGVAHEFTILPLFQVSHTATYNFGTIWEILGHCYLGRQTGMTGDQC